MIPGGTNVPALRSFKPLNCSLFVIKWIIRSCVSIMIKHLCLVVDAEKKMQSNLLSGLSHRLRVAAWQSQPKFKSTNGKRDSCVLCFDANQAYNLEKLCKKNPRNKKKTNPQGASSGNADTLNSNGSCQYCGISEAVFWKGNIKWFTKRRDTVRDCQASGQGKWKHTRSKRAPLARSAGILGKRHWRQLCTALTSFWAFNDHRSTEF